MFPAILSERLVVEVIVCAISLLLGYFEGLAYGGGSSRGRGRGKGAHGRGRVYRLLRCDISVILKKLSFSD